MAWSGAVPPPRKLPKPPPEWVQAGLSKSQLDKLDVDGKRLALLKAQDQGINPTGDESLPFQWGPLAAKLAQLGYSAGTRQLIKRRLIKDASGKPQPFYHGAQGKYYGDIDPRKTKGWAAGDVYLTTAPETANVYALSDGVRKASNFTRGNAGGAVPAGARVYPKYIAPLRGKNPGVQFSNTQYWGPSSEIHAIAADPRVLIPPYAIAPPPMPNFLPYLAPPVIGSQ